MRKRLQISGFVQGVGFRPFVKRTAKKFAVGGFVKNTAKGVTVEVEGSHQEVEDVVKAIQYELPFPAQIHDIKIDHLEDASEKDFVILPSEEGKRSAAFFPLDMAVCENCVREMFDQQDRRHKYPFINCTACGPRYTILQKIPYDRKSTTMSSFVMCEKCAAEYESSEDRRFHAQPNACPECGPQVEFSYDTLKAQGSAAIRMLALHLSRQGVAAIKGLGGYHLACDARDEIAVRKIRQLKGREKKPFAVMVCDLVEAQSLCEVSPAEKESLLSSASPIVLLDKKKNALANSVAPNNKRLGLFLPYAPLHHLLFAEGAPRALVMTSANESEEPIMCDDSEARDKWGKGGAAILSNDRPINFRCDDSVVQVIGDRQCTIRAGRGIMPRPFDMPCKSASSGIAIGADLKNTFCILLAGNPAQAVVSPHIGDLENPAAQCVLEDTIARYLDIFGVTPEFVAVDMHPRYFGRDIGRKLADKYNAELISVQHHHAHIASAMVENRLSGKVAGLAMDATGFGSVKSIWGGEALVCDYESFLRTASISEIRLIGADLVAREPWRVAVAALVESGRRDLAIRLFPKTAQFISIMESNMSFPKTSGLGRIFDAAAAIALGIEASAYEAQAAILLEQAADGCESSASYEVSFEKDEAGLKRAVFHRAFSMMAEDRLSGLGVGLISRKFHNTVIRALLMMADSTDKELPIVLSGGCFQNRIILTGLVSLLEKSKRKVYSHKILPHNDGALSLGQAMIGLAKYCAGKGRN